MRKIARGSSVQRVPAWLEKYGEGLRRFIQFAADRGLHPAQLAIAWVRHTPGVTAPIVGVSSERQLQSNLGAFDVELSPEEYTELAAMFDAAVKEEAGGNYPNLRRSFDLVAE